MGNEIVKFDKKIVNLLDKAARMGALATSMTEKFERTFTIAEGIQILRDNMTSEVMIPLMNLQGSGLGFRTDKPNGYDSQVVRDCIIEATMRGLYPCNNEFNIIAGRTYITKEGFAHLLANIAGLSYTIIPGIPAIKEGGAIIDMTIRWTFNGKNEEQKLPICVRVNSGMGADAIIGKATRKARAWLHATITGQEIADGDTLEDGKVIDIKAEAVTGKANDLFKGDK